MTEYNDLKNMSYFTYKIHNSKAIRMVKEHSAKSTLTSNHNVSEPAPQIACWAEWAWPQSVMWRTGCLDPMQREPTCSVKATGTHSQMRAHTPWKKRQASHVLLD